MSGPRRTPALESVDQACYAGADDLGQFRDRLLRSLRRVVPFDAAFMAAVDPDTLLFTNVFADTPLADSGPRFLDNEFGATGDVNRFADLARARDPVASLDGATGGVRAVSARWREIMGPLGMGDELRVARRIDGTTWGFLCLHRAGAGSFDAGEMAALRKVAPHAGHAIRRTSAVMGDTAEGPDAVILVADHVVLAVGGAVEQIGLAGLGVGRSLPLPLAALVRRLEAIERGGERSSDTAPAAIRLTTASGALIAVHATRLHSATGSGPVVLTVAPAGPTGRASLLLAAHGLTPAQCRVATLVLRGRTTGQIVVDLHISAHTVQDHLKAVFDKVGVRNRRDLVSALMNPAR